MPMAQIAAPRPLEPVELSWRAIGRLLPLIIGVSMILQHFTRKRAFLSVSTSAVMHFRPVASRFTHLSIVSRLAESLPLRLSDIRIPRPDRHIIWGTIIGSRA